MLQSAARELSRPLQWSVWAFLDVEDLGALAAAAHEWCGKVHVFMGQLRQVDLSQPLARHPGCSLPRALRTRCHALRAVCFQQQQQQSALDDAALASLVWLVRAHRAQFTGLISSRPLHTGTALFRELSSCPRLECFSGFGSNRGGEDVWQQFVALKHLRHLVLDTYDGCAPTMSQWFSLLAVSKLETLAWSDPSPVLPLALKRPSAASLRELRVGLCTSWSSQVLAERTERTRFALDLCAAAATLPLLEALEIAGSTLWRRKDAPSARLGTDAAHRDGDWELELAPLPSGQVVVCKKKKKMRLRLLEMPLSLLAQMGDILGARVDRFWIEDPLVSPADNETMGTAARFPNAQTLHWLAPRAALESQAAVLRGLLAAAPRLCLYLPRHHDYAQAADFPNLLPPPAAEAGAEREPRILSFP